MHDKFAAFDIECVDVLVGKPNTADSSDNGKKIEALLDQLRQRQLAKEQVETYQHRQVAAAKERELNETTARTTKQKELTDSEIQIKIAENQGNAELSRAEMRKRQTVVEAEARLEQSKREAQTVVINAKADAEQTLVKAEANSQSLILAGKGEGQKTMQIGMSQAITLQQKVNAYGDPRLYAMIQTAAELAKSVQPAGARARLHAGRRGQRRPGGGRQRVHQFPQPADGGEHDVRQRRQRPVQQPGHHGHDRQADRQCAGNDERHEWRRQTRAGDAAGAELKPDWTGAWPLSWFLPEEGPAPWPRLPLSVLLRLRGFTGRQPFAMFGHHVCEVRIGREVSSLPGIGPLVVKFFTAAAVVDEPPVPAADGIIAAAPGGDGRAIPGVVGIAEQRSEALPKRPNVLSKP